MISKRSGLATGRPSNDGSSRRLIRVLIILALGISLPGCAGFGPEPLRGPLTGAQQTLYSLKNWRMEGRIGVRTDADAWQANLFWEHDSAQDRLRVSGPLSQGMLSIVVQKDLILVNRGEGRSELSRDPDALLRERLGFSVPLASLRYWILGVPDPGLAYSSIYGDDGAWNGFRQNGWTVGLDRMLNVGDRVLPQKMRVYGSGVRLTIVTDNWEIGG